MMQQNTVGHHVLDHSILWRVANRFKSTAYYTGHLQIGITDAGIVRNL